MSNRINPDDVVDAYVNNKLIYAPGDYGVSASWEQANKYIVVVSDPHNCKVCPLGALAVGKLFSYDTISRYENPDEEIALQSALNISRPYMFGFIHLIDGSASESDVAAFNDNQEYEAGCADAKLVLEKLSTAGLLR